jgi:hypothetical protein
MPQGYLNRIAFLFYILLFIIYPLIPDYRIPQNINIFLCVFALHSVFGGILLHRGNMQLSTLFFIFIASRICIFPMLPWLSDDVFAYLFYGKATLHGINLYAVSPSDPSIAYLRDDAWNLMFYKDLPLIYPPLSTWLMSAGIAVGTLFGTGWKAALFGWKIILFLMESAGLYILYRYFPEKNKAVQMMQIYVLMPITAIEILGQAHNDGLLLPVISGLCLCSYHIFTFQKRNLTIFFAGILAGMALMIKLLPFLLILPFLRISLRINHLFLLILGISIPCIITGYWHFSGILDLDFTAVNGFRSVLAFYTATLFNGVPLYMIRWTLQALNISEWWLKAPGILGILRFGSALTAGLYKKSDSPQALTKSMFYILLIILLISQKVHTWYFVPALLIGGITGSIAIWYISGIMMLSYMMYSFNPPVELYWAECIYWLPALWLLYREMKGRFPIKSRFSLT